MKEEYEDDKGAIFIPSSLSALVITDWSGQTKSIIKNAETYEVMHGKGIAKFKDGQTYEGEIRNGMLHGRGTFTWIDKTVYKGKFRNNEITGSGRYEWPDGTVYEGDVKEGIRHGKGAYINEKEY
jgi:hypothetical protein